VPEVPDLVSVAAVLNRHLPGLRVIGVDLLQPIVVRVAREEFQARLQGAVLGRVRRYGKFLLFALESGDVLVVNAMLVGRFQYVEPGKKRHARTGFALSLSDGRELRYVDQRLMGKVYLVAEEALDTVPQFGVMGPDVLDPGLTEDVFLERLKRYRGQVKNVLVNAQFVAGIGNAYVDEILFIAGVHPFTKVSTLDESRRRDLYRAIHAVMAWAIPIVAEEMGEQTDKKPRDFLRVHRKGGAPCPTCGTTISEVSPNRRVTSFCRRCQAE
jgi:formamidopyrimidine-DNA glycosylase